MSVLKTYKPELKGLAVIVLIAAGVWFFLNRKLENQETGNGSGMPSTPEMGKPKDKAEMDTTAPKPKQPLQVISKPKPSIGGGGYGKVEPTREREEMSMRLKLPSNPMVL